MRFATSHNIGTVSNRVFDMATDFFESLLINQRPLVNTIAGTGPYGHAGRFLGQPRGECVINAVLDKNAVRTNACLTSVTKFRQHGALNRDIKIGIIKHQQRRVTT